MTAEEIHSLLCGALLVRRVAEGFHVATHCLYPSNDTVWVSVRPALGDFVVSDGGRAADQSLVAGVFPPVTDQQVRALVAPQGLDVEKGEIMSPRVKADRLLAAIMLVANASKEVAQWTLEHTKMKVSSDFRVELAKMLAARFGSNLHNNQPIVGSSNKPHRFSHVISLTNMRRLLIDPVVPDNQSIYQRVASNVDVKLLEDEATTQLIIYDGRQDWPSSDLKLLELGAQTVEFRRAEDVIVKLAA